MLAGWMNRHQQQVIEYLKAENRMLKAYIRDWPEQESVNG